VAFTWGYWGAVCWMAKAAAGVSRSSRLRRKLGDPPLIQTITNYGYRIMG